MRIAVTYDLRADYLAMGMSEEECAEFDLEVTISALVKTLAALGHEPVRIGNIHALTQRLAAGERWDAAFNICEGLLGYAREAQVPALLEAYGIPHVFSDALTQAVSLDKAWTKRIVAAAGVPTPAFQVIEHAADIAKITLAFPLFVKPIAEGSGKGVNARSKVSNTAELKAVATELLARYRQPVLVETYLPGRELTVGIVGTGDDARSLGVLDIIPKATAETPDYGFENKENCDDYVSYQLVDGVEGQRAADVALGAWRALRCRDGGRIDIRYDAAGHPQFIEVNPLAGLNPEHSDLCFIARFRGLDYQDLIGLIMTSFLKRHPELAGRRAAA